MHTAGISTSRAWSALVAAMLCLSAGTAAAQELSGADVWAATCGSCHRLRGVDSYTASQWSSIVTHMALVARLTPAETRAVRDFLAPEARATIRPGRAIEFATAAAADLTDPSVGTRAAQGGPTPAATGRDIYRVYCAACHGAQGRGDGPAARGLRTRPRNLTNGSEWTLTTDSQIVELIRVGGRGMPPFRALRTAQVDSVMAYVKSLRR